MAAKPPDAFLSYTHFDDQYHGGAIGKFCDRLSMAVQAVTAKPFEIFRDVDGIELGENWRGRLNIALGEARFFIPILTPNYFESKACRDELARFLEFEKQSGRNDLILPIYYLDCRHLEDPELRATDPLAAAIHERQHHDWRKLRNKPFGSSAVRTELERLAHRIDRARRRPAERVPTKGADTFGRARLVSIDPGTVLRDVDAFWCPEIVVIPPGEFMMGRPEGEETYGNERPQHLVKISYWLAVGRYPITFDEYDHFTEITDRELPSDDGWGRGRRPLINVTWYDATAYVQWLEFQTGHPYRLLSEAEWEYACRAGTTTRYWWGDEITPEQANYGENIGRTSEVGTYRANPWGLYDMHGNVWEWVADRWHDTYDGAPDDGSAWTAGGRSVVQRGGSWQHEPTHLRSASRTSASAGHPRFMRAGRNRACPLLQAPTRGSRIPAPRRPREGARAGATAPVR